jgi:UDP-4-amino-4,6-dideoxy-N-acetyl-beta-L-altrosamine transaminase
MKLIPYGRQVIDRRDIQKVSSVLKSDLITQGLEVGKFEEALCKYTGARYAVAVSSGTAALYLACLAADIKQPNEVITSPITFVASANCVLYCGGKPVFADIQEDTANINPQEIRRRVTKKTKAIIPVHFTGNPCDLEEIREIANKYNMVVIEDAAHALGAKYKDSKIGSCRYSDMTIFSFHPVKAITTGEGGAVLTNKKVLYEKLLILRNHGITKDRKFLKNDFGPWYYEMQCLGFNYRITDFQAALGKSQLEKLDEFVKRRKEIAVLYNNALADIGWVRPLCRQINNGCAFHIYVVLIDFKKIKKSRKEVMECLKRQGIGTQVHYIPVYKHPYYRGLNYSFCDYPLSEKYYDMALTLPLYPSMTLKDIKRIINEVLALG